MALIIGSLITTGDAEAFSNGRNIFIYIYKLRGENVYTIPPKRHEIIKSKEIETIS